MSAACEDLAAAEFPEALLLIPPREAGLFCHPWAVAAPKGRQVKLLDVSSGVDVHWVTDDAAHDKIVRRLDFN